MEARGDTPGEPDGQDLRGTGQVLVVDDQHMVQQTARHALERAGYSVLLASDGAQAVELLQRHAGEILLVVLDMTMPGLTGEETLDLLRGVRPTIPIVISSGYSETVALPAIREPDRRLSTEALYRGGFRPRGTDRSRLRKAERSGGVKERHNRVDMSFVQERRSEIRMMCADMVQVRWKTPGGRAMRATGLLEDISPSGACLQMERAIPLGTEIRWQSAGQAYEGAVRYCVYREIGYFVGVQFAGGVKWSREDINPSTSSTWSGSRSTPGSRVAAAVHSRTVQYRGILDLYYPSPFGPSYTVELC